MKKAFRPARRSTQPTARLDRRKDDEDVADHIVGGVRAAFVRDSAADRQPPKKSRDK